MAADEKAPAFQFYPRDWDADERVIPMTAEEEGVYWALCRRYWLAGNILPSDPAQLREMLKWRFSAQKFEQLWKRIGRCFQVDGDRLRQRRLDRERAKQIENKTKRQKAAEERWAKDPTRKQKDAPAPDVQMQSTPPVDAMQCLASASSSASAIASADNNHPSKPQPVVLGPRSFDRQHASHLGEFCAFQCLSEEKAHNFAKNLPGGQRDLRNFERVIDWARTLRAGWGDRPIIEPTWWEFWQARWTEHLKTLTSADAGDAYAAQVMAETEARRRPR